MCVVGLSVVSGGELKEHDVGQYSSKKKKKKRSVVGKKKKKKKKCWVWGPGIAVLWICQRV